MVAGNRGRKPLALTLVAPPEPLIGYTGPGVADAVSLQLGSGVSTMAASFSSMKPWLSGRRVGAVALAAGLLAARGAGALGIQDTNPLFFIGGGQYGFTKAAVDAAGLGIGGETNSQDDFISAGNVQFNPELSITQSLGPIYRNPQAAYQNPAGGCHAGDVCQTPTNPFIADSTWTITNNSGRDLDNVYLVFTRVMVSTPYPNIPVALDGNLIQILEYTDTGTSQKYWFAMLSIGALGDGNANDGTPGEKHQSTQFSMRYIVGGDMPFSSNVQVMPPIGVYGLEHAGGFIPEPGTALLLASGLMLLGMANRSRA